MSDPALPTGDLRPPAATPPETAGFAPGVLPLASVIAKPRSSAGRSTSILFLLAGAIAVGGIAFAGGRLTAPAAATSGRTADGQRFTGSGQGLSGNGQLPGGGQAFPGRDGFGGISLTGTVDAVSVDSITLKLPSGNTITIPLDAATAYHRAAAATAGDVAIGSEVRVTPGARTAVPGATLTPNASAAPGVSAAPGAAGAPVGGQLSFGAATDVTVIGP